MELDGDPLVRLEREADPVSVGEGDVGRNPRTDVMATLPTEWPYTPTSGSLVVVASPPASGPVAR